jgi:protein-tyrosine phosphatase
MARAAAEAGTATIASTPHLRSDFPDVHVRELADRSRQVRAAIERERIPIRVVDGAEVSVTWAVDASEEELAFASYGQRGTDLLIETPTSSVIGLDRFLFELRTRGYRITLAHPERSTDFQRDDAPLRALGNQGVLLQINAESLIGAGIRSRAGRLARSLCSDGVAHVLASDGHRSASWRAISALKPAVEAASALIGKERSEWMACAAPAAILDGIDLPAPPPIASSRRRRIFRR